MNIVIFNWRDLKNPQSGGAELYLHEQAKYWASLGHKVSWITSRSDKLPEREKIDGINFIRKGGKLSVYLFSPFIFFRECGDADVVIDAENGIPFFTPLFTSKKKILLIHHIHKDVWFKEFSFPISWIGYILENKIMPFFYKKNPVVTVSPSSAEEIKKLLPKNKISIIYNAISPKYRPGKKAKNPELVYVGRLKKYKSIDVLLKAIALVDKNLKLNIIGRGDDESRLKKISKSLGLKNVNFLGFVSEKEKIRYIQQAWMAVNPSFVEGWSITNVEASACATPVIGSNVHGIKDSIKNGKTGYLFPYGNEQELSKKIKILIENRSLRKRMEKQSVAWASHFSWKKSAEAFLELMKK